MIDTEGVEESDIFLTSGVDDEFVSVDQCNTVYSVICYYYDCICYANYISIIYRVSVLLGQELRVQLHR